MVDVVNLLYNLLLIMVQCDGDFAEVLGDVVKDGFDVSGVQRTEGEEGVLWECGVLMMRRCVRFRGLVGDFGDSFKHI